MNADKLILLIDDDKDDRELFCAALKEIDPAITCVDKSTGQAALDYLSDVQHPIPDFIFLDLRMPGLSGQKCLQAIKKMERVAHVPVIVYTTSREVIDSIELKKMGAAHFMSKPDSRDEIYYMLSVVLSEKWD